MARIACLGTLIALFGCEQPPDETPEGDEPRCGLAGRWAVEEARVGGDCAPDAVPERPLVLDITAPRDGEPGAVWGFELTRGGEPMESCTGVPSDDACRVELTCHGNIEGDRIDYALTIDVSESDELTGTNELAFVAEPCNAVFDLSGERVAEAESETS